ncbi:MAG: hypothetical protein IJ525_04005 [Alphaproteobacteria bacterium]|nr:hypothetical protein [Alphaproteobacteria bacterium]
MKNLEIKNLQSNFNQAEDALTIPVESRHDYKCGSATQSGRSMIEMLGVLAIIGVLSVGGIAGYSKAMQKYRINKTIEQITLIAGNIRAFFGPQKNYIGVSCSCGGGSCPHNGCPVIKKAKILPDDMLTVTDGKIMSITNPFGGWVSLRILDKAKNGDNQAFEIALTDLPQEACIELLSQDWSNSNVSIIRLQRDTDTEYVFFHNFPASIDNVTESCVHNNHLELLFDTDVNFMKNDEKYGEMTWY